MAKKKTSRPPKGSASGKKGPLLSQPDISVLARYAPDDPVGSHPEWVKARFGAYIAPHAGHEAAVVREFSHRGHQIKIITSYRVEVDGQAVRTPLSVDEDGRVFSHATPFVTYVSAVELMRAVIDAYPEAFSVQADHGEH